MPIDFKSCRDEIAGALQEFCNRWCKREHVESNALNILYTISLAISYIWHLYVLIFVQCRTISNAMTRTGS